MILQARLFAQSLGILMLISAASVYSYHEKSYHEKSYHEKSHHSVVAFSPEVYARGASLPCQAMISTDVHIATSKGCVAALTRKRSEQAVYLLSGKTEVGELLNYPSGHPLDIASRLDSENLLPFKAYDSAFVSQSNFTFSHSQTESRSPDDYFLLYQSAEGVPLKQPLSLKAYVAASRLYKFELPEGLEYPPGAPVFHKDAVACLWTGDGECISPDDVARRVKRGGDGSCKIHHFKCSNPSFLICHEQMGVAECTNDLNGQRCNVMVYPGGGGTEKLFCPYDCVDRTCSCEARWMDGQVSTKPDDCVGIIEDAPEPEDVSEADNSKNSTDTASFVDKHLGEIIGASVGVPVVIVTTVVIVCTLYYFRKKRGNDYRLLTQGYE